MTEFEIMEAKLSNFYKMAAEGVGIKTENYSELLNCADQMSHVLSWYNRNYHGEYTPTSVNMSFKDVLDAYQKCRSKLL